MAVLGIVAEYDPFHNGHLRHLRSAVSVVAPSAVLVALSGPFKQRGDPSLLSPFARAEAVDAELVLMFPERVFQTFFDDVRRGLDLQTDQVCLDFICFNLHINNTPFVCCVRFPRRCGACTRPRGMRSQ